MTHVIIKKINEDITILNSTCFIHNLFVQFFFSTINSQEMWKGYGDASYVWKRVRLSLEQLLLTGVHVPVKVRS